MAQGIGDIGVKAKDFDTSYSLRNKEDEIKEKDFRDNPPIFNVAFNHSTGGRGDGAFNA